MGPPTGHSVGHPMGSPIGSPMGSPMASKSHGTSRGWAHGTSHDFPRNVVRFLEMRCFKADSFVGLGKLVNLSCLVGALSHVRISDRTSIPTAPTVVTRLSCPRAWKHSSIKSGASDNLRH